MNPERSRLRRLARGLFISFSVLIGVLLIAEVSVRLFTDTIRPLLVVDPVLGRRYVKDFEGVVFNPESDRDVNVRFNDQGFRFPDLPFEKPAGTRRVVLLGDSMIAGMQVDAELTAAGILEQRLNETASEGERWEVLNFGVSGASTAQEYVLYRELARKYHPDLVLCVFFVGNDFGDNSPRLSSRNRIYFDLDERGELVQLPYPPLRTRFNELLDEYSRLYVWQKEATAEAKRVAQAAAPAADSLEERHAWHGESVRPSEWVYYTGEDEICDHSWRITAGVIGGMASIAAADGASFGLVLLPSSLQVHDEEFAYLREVAGERGAEFDPEYPNRRLGAICDELGVPFFDLLPGFRAAEPSHSELVEEEWLFLNGRGHFNEKGNVVFAELVAGMIGELERP